MDDLALLSGIMLQGGDVNRLDTSPCIHISQHRQPCSVCTPTPPEHLWAAYELSGDPGRKNGAKLLFAAIKAHPRWQSLTSRQEAVR